MLRFADGRRLFAEPFGRSVKTDGRLAYMVPAANLLNILTPESLMRHICLAICICMTIAVPAASGPLPGSTLMDEAFRAAQWAHLSSAGTALRQTAARRAAGDDALAQLLQERQILLDRIDRAERQLAETGGTEAGETLATTAELGGEINAAQAGLDLIDQKLAVEHPDFRLLTRPSPVSVVSVQEMLAPDEGLVFVFSGDRAVFVWAITPEVAAWHRVNLPRASVEASVTEIRRSLIQANTLRSAAALEDDPENGVPFAAVHSMLLYSEILRPLERYLEGVGHLYSVVDGPLSGLPLSLLITDWTVENETLSLPEEFRRAGWLFQRHALTTLPSVDSLGLVTARGNAPPEGFIGFGDPDFSGTVSAPSDGQFFRGAGADPESLRALAPLPGTRRELDRLADLFDAGPDALYLGRAATETAVKAAPLDRAGVIAFATHGLLSGELRGLAEPALALSPPAQVQPGDDGLLTASEIAELSLNADWVVLSACNTAGGDGTPDAEGLSGLARAFLFAGARSLMVSHWPVRDDAAARLTTATFDALRTGQTRRKAEALQTAMQDMLTDPAAPDMAHPAAWAPFVVVGHGG